jgi:peptidoglycan-associated lipoprotein
MRKHSQLFLALFITLSLLTGCASKMQSPAKSDTVTSPGAGGNTSRFSTPANPSDFGNGGSTPAEPITPATIVNPDLTERSDNLPKIDWDHPPAELIVATVYFGFDQFNLSRDDPVTHANDQDLMATVAKALAADPTLHVVAVGHCDWYGSDQYNLALSDRRSNTVKGYLTQLGGGAGQTDILARGKYGATPDAKKNSPEAMHDRRVDVVKIPAGATLPLGAPPVAGAATPAATP